MFNESEWLRLLYLLSDTGAWLDEMEKRMFLQLPGMDKKKLFRKAYHLSAAALVHILEKHYYKISRHPASSKFTIPVAEILHHLRRGAELSATVCYCTGNLKRMIQTSAEIGHDKTGLPTNIITVITTPAGKIITAYPDAPSVPPSPKKETSPATTEKNHEEVLNASDLPINS